MALSDCHGYRVYPRRMKVKCQNHLNNLCLIESKSLFNNKEIKKNFLLGNDNKHKSKYVIGLLTHGLWHMSVRGGLMPAEPYARGTMC